MDIGNLNAAVRYIDDNLCGEIDVEKAGMIACVEPTAFSVFSATKYINN